MDFLKKTFFKEMEKKAFLVASLLEQKKATLAIAESLTGGLVSHLLTLKPGASQFFLGSIVCYSSAIKTKHLGIPKSLLKKEGVVSKALALLMAHNVKKKWRSDYGLSLTGLAGPSKEEGDPSIGTVFVGFSGPQGDKVKDFLVTPKLKAESVGKAGSVGQTLHAPKLKAESVGQAWHASLTKAPLLPKALPPGRGKRAILEARWAIQQKSAILALAFLKTCIEAH